MPFQYVVALKVPALAGSKVIGVSNFEITTDVKLSALDKTTLLNSFEILTETQI